MQDDSSSTQTTKMTLLTHSVRPDTESGLSSNQQQPNAAAPTVTAGLVPEQPAADSSVWHAPSYDFSGMSIRSGSYRLDTGRGDNLFRSARWCMDGSTILSTAEDRTVRLLSTNNLDDPDLSANLTLPLPAPALSSLWYPSAASSSPQTFCFALGIRDTPVRLVDAQNGHIRAVYPIVDHRERFVAPYSMAWNPTATKLYCGHENAIEILDIAAPGYDTSERIKTSQTRGDKGGQKGIISALSFSSDYSGTYAAGGFSGSVSLYSEDVAGSVGHLEGLEGGGVTQLAFHPLSPTHLFVASRRSSQLQVYDLRNPSAAFHVFPRAAPTNQRLGFDLDPWGRYLAIGDATGKVSVWDVGGSGAWGEKVWEEHVGHDAISSLQFHPLKPALLVSSGSRGTQPTSDRLDSSDSERSDSGSSDETSGMDEIDGVVDAVCGSVKGATSKVRSDLQILGFEGASRET